MLPDLRGIPRRKIEREEGLLRPSSLSDLIDFQDRCASARGEPTYKSLDIPKVIGHTGSLYPWNPVDGEQNAGGILGYKRPVIRAIYHRREDSTPIPK